MNRRDLGIFIVVGASLVLIAWLALSDRQPHPEESAEGHTPKPAIAEIVQSLERSGQGGNEAQESAAALEERRDFIRKYRVAGAEFIIEQRKYVEAVADREARRELEKTFTKANRIWLGAVIAEMVTHDHYRQAVAGLMNDGQFRRFAIDNLGDLMPGLIDYLKTGKRVGAAEAEQLFHDKRDFQAEFDELRINLPENLAARFESEIGSMIAGDVLHWQFLTENPSAATDSAFAFFWGGRVPDPNE